MGPAPPGPGVLPGHGMRLWLYLPAGAHAAKSLPCVLIAPGGSNLIIGNELNEGRGDHPEHLPYARAGFAVLAYGLDGDIRDRRSVSDSRLKLAIQTFLAARAGLVNAEIALAWLLAEVPEVDPERLYTAGHSSAGTMALLLAENEPRIKACAAFDPCPDITTNFDAAATRDLRALFPEIDALFTTYNPKRHAADIRCPVLLTHARDDGVVPLAETEAFAAELRRLGKTVTLEVIPSGGHYWSMIHAGVPRAVAWFHDLAKR
jgi:dipeptidyl aminopeptidase/acylaminoacyl peptidase